MVLSHLEWRFLAPAEKNHQTNHAMVPVNSMTGTLDEAQTWWAVDAESAVSAMTSNAAEGLTEHEVLERRRTAGPNVLRSHRRRTPLSIFIGQFRSVIVALLIVAATAALFFGELAEAAAVAVVIVTNTVIGFVTESRAVRSMEALRSLGRRVTRVIRDGRIHEIDAELLVPGDIVVIEGGDLVTADMRIIEASKLQADESMLTGESMPVSKEIRPVASDTLLAERLCMLYKGTAITRGSGKGVIVATGMQTELGHISSLVESAEASRTPLEQRLDRLGRTLIWVTLGIAAVAAIAGIVQGRDMILMIEMGIALAVATVPEGLPIVATIALATGMREMADRNALINRLSSVETLGATTLILTDKTGTLTENKMTVIRLELHGGEVQLEEGGFHVDKDDPLIPLATQLLELSVLCNNASLPQEEGAGGTGDPTEVALLQAAESGGIDIERVKDTWPEIGEEAFDPDVRMMATYHKDGDNILVAVKGAPDSVLKHCTHMATPEGVRPLTEEDIATWNDKNEVLSGEGLRMLAVAFGSESTMPQRPYAGLTLVGFTAMQDPARPDVQEAIEACHQAGIDVMMVTGDGGLTASSIADSVGIPTTRVWNGTELDEALSSEQLDGHVFARVNPAQKLQLIQYFQERGHIVAMTGDGVNDAPALKTADIGIAMGLRGTQVAQDASDMVLRDDAFATIVSAIDRGRVIFENIRRFLVFLLSCNVSEVMIVGLATTAGFPLPILPLQLLFLNFVTDVFPALALGVGRGEENIMDRPPRPPQEDILAYKQWMDVALFGGLITVATLSALYISLVYLKVPSEEVVTITFLTLALAQLWNVFNMRSAQTSVLANDIVKNRWVLRSLLLCSGLIAAALYVPGLSDVLVLRPPSALEWSLILPASLFPLFAGQVVLYFRGAGELTSEATEPAFSSRNQPEQS